MATLIRIRKEIKNLKIIMKNMLKLTDITAFLIVIFTKNCDAMQFL